MICNAKDKNGITHLCLMANEGIENRDTSDSYVDDDDCTSDDKEEEAETGNDILDEVYDLLSNYSKCKLIKVLLYYIRHQGHISKIKDLKKTNFELSQENLEFQKSNDSLANNLKSFQEKFVLLKQQKDELNIKCVNLEKIILKFSKGEKNLNKILGIQKASFNKEGI